MMHGQTIITVLKMWN